MLRFSDTVIDGARAEARRLARVVLVVAIVAAGLPLAAHPISAGIGDLPQLEFRWYQNLDAVQPTTALAAQDTAANGVTQGGVYHPPHEPAEWVQSLVGGRRHFQAPARYVHEWAMD